MGKYQAKIFQQVALSLKKDGRPKTEYPSLGFFLNAVVGLPSSVYFNRMPILVILPNVKWNMTSNTN
jgi:hypothetical protein